MAVATLPLGKTFGAGRRTLPSRLDWLIFAVQAVLVVLVDASNDIIRGNIQPPNAAEAVGHAQAVASFEAAHGLFIEPAVQRTLAGTHHVLGLIVTWPDIVSLVNGIYAFGHIFVTLAVAAWLYVHHRAGFRVVRNIMLLTNALAFAIYELFPMAPPRLTPGLSYDGRPFHFQDTMGHVLGSGTLNGTPIAYNPLSAMPSVHVAWALIIGVSLIVFSRHVPLKAFGALYPLVMILTVVTTANHYIMDAVGAVAVVTVASALVLVLFPRAARLRSAHSRIAL